MHPVASSSRLPPPGPPPPPPRRPRSRPRRGMRRSTAAFVLSLCAPYFVSASPLPDTTARLATGHDPHPNADGANGTLADAVADAALAVVQGSASALWRRDRTHNPLARRWAQLDFARFDSQGFVRVPENMVELQQTVNPGFIVLSYLISLVGALCTLELLIRRTSNRGFSNLLLLATAGICFGSVSTWAMHFVGNQSLALHHPNPDFPVMYLSYGVGYTILSIVASCLAMTFAFFVMGTDIRLGEWRTWRCIPGSRGRRRREAASPSARDDYTRWKRQKAKIRKSANVNVIFQQAGMVASWSLMDSPRPRSELRSWKDFFFGQREAAAEAEAPERFQPRSAFMDEETMIERDKELCEIDFRFGRNAVREELDRRQMQVSMSRPESPAQSLDGSITNGLGVSPLPASPLAAYYPTNITKPHAKDSQDHGLIETRQHPHANGITSPMAEVFTPSFSFPPRNPVDASSTTNLLPQRTESNLNGSAWPPTGQLVSTDGGLFPGYGRRASLPVITPPPPPRVTTLARIQSLPEHDPEYPPAEHSTDSSTSKEDQFVSSSDGTYDSNHMDPDGILYEEEHIVRKAPGWRQVLRTKVQTGAQLTRMEQAERFLGLDVVTWGDIGKIFFTGMMAGWGVAGMHYIGQVSINGIPYIAYRVGYVVGSVVIASGAVIIALYIMFIMLRPKLKHSWAAKGVVGLILAGAVCGMHYTAMMGTIYGFPRNGEHPTGGMGGTKRAITGIVAALAFVACVGVTIFILINSIRDRKERARRRRVVVASVLLDDQDRMLVSAIDGLLPMCDIASLTSADHPLKKSKKNRAASSDASSAGESSALGVDLTTGNDAFVQAMKMSWSWRNPFWSSMNPFASLSSLVGSEQDKAAAATAAAVAAAAAAETSPSPNHPLLQQHRGSTTTQADSLVSAFTHPTRVSVARFLEKFAISATQLSVRLTGQQEGISRLGVLYDQILTTGWVSLRNGKGTVSKGQLIFLVRRVTSAQERSDLLSRHFIFADTSAVAMSLHKTLSTPYEHVMPFLDDMRSFCDTTSRMTLRPNTLYAGAVVVQATPFDGLRILLNHRNRSQLPMREVCTFSTLPGLPVNVSEGLAGTLEEIGEAVTWLEGMNLLSVITRNMSPEATRVGGPRVGRLLGALERAVVPLLDELLSQDDLAYILPRLTLHPVLVPLTPAAPARLGVPGWQAPHVIVFYANYDITVNTFADKWLPFSLFRAQHECVMATKISVVTRAAESAAQGPRSPRPPSPAAIAPASCHPVTAGSPDPSKYNYGRRPSKVQFEVPVVEPGLASYSFPPREGAGTPSNAPTVSPTTAFTPSLFSSRDRQPPRRSSLAKSTLRDEPAAVDRDTRLPGVAQWDQNWLVHLLRARLRAEA